MEARIISPVLSPCPVIPHPRKNLSHAPATMETRTRPCSKLIYIFIE